MPSSQPATCHPESTRHTREGLCQSCYGKTITTLQWRTIHYKRQYGLTLDQVHAMLAKQDYKCGICRQPIELGKTGKIAHLDHEHDTGRIRGFLCISCNSKLDWTLRYMEAINDYLGLNLAEEALRV